MLDACSARYWSDITASAIDAYLRNKEFSNRTYNLYIHSMKSFAHWMVETGRAAESPAEKLKWLKVWPAKRRALTFEEMCRLLKVTAGEPKRYGMTGMERAVLYLLAVETGLRYAELRSLKVGSFDFDNAVVTVRAECCKNRLEAVQYLKRKRADQLRVFFANRDAEDQAFALQKHSPGSRMLRSDLDMARILAVDTRGVKVVFHSLRHTLATALDRTGATMKERRTIMRHSDRSDLTLGTYTHLEIVNLRAAVEKLPDYPWPGDSQQQAGEAVA
jgi:site-specific recombinase XerD